MPKAKIQEEETHPPEEEPAPPVQETPPEAPPEAPPDPVPDAPAVPETPAEETVPKPRKAAKAKPRKDAPETPAEETVPKPRKAESAKATSRKDAPKKTKKEAWAPGEVTIPQPPALLRQTPEPEIPQLTQAQALRMHLATAAQERRAQAHLRVVNPIRQFYGL